MTPAEMSVLLTYVSTVDDRMVFTDPAIVGARVRSWAGILHDVEFPWASEHARRYYAKAGQPKITPAEIRSAWLGHLRRADSMTRPQQGRTGAPPVGVMDYLRQVVRATQAGRDPDSVPRPPSVPLTPDEDRASRKCVNWRNCACPHEVCRDGWLDQEERIVNGLGLGYPAVKRCLHCYDAATMAAELATPVRSRVRR